MTNYENCPTGLQDSLQRYIEKGSGCGDFLTAVLSNDLRMAVSRADSTNLPRIPEIVRWLYNEAPSGCTGAREKVVQWGLNGGLTQFEEDELDWSPPTLASGKTAGPI